jgi:two-component system chemotaxis response regulator CheY
MSELGHNILIVDDSATTRAVIKRTLKMADIPLHQVLEAPNGKAALEVLECVKVDLVLADLHMPQMTGVEMAAAMHANPAMRGIPVVVVSAEPNVEKLQRLTSEAGIRGYVRKPFTPEQIAVAVRSVLEGVATHA